MSHHVLRPFLARLLGALLVLAATGIASANEVEKAGQGGFNQFIVQFKAGSQAHGNAALRQRALDVPGRALGLSVNQVRRMALGADVVRTSKKLNYRAAEAFMNRLRANPDVQYVEVDRVVRPTLVPNDTFYNGNQWHYYEATGGINLPATWDIATGTGTVVAVLDTGITSHSDLNANVVTGYDFITNVTTAGDGNGRDADPSDTGDWTTADQCNPGDAAEDSSWHGTHVAGTIAAVTNNNKGVAGVAFNAKVMPVRVLGHCGGVSSDIADAIVWAAGGAVSGVPNNANPVEVINMSLGGPGSCNVSTQNAINYAVNAGVIVVVSAGNDNADAGGYQPASCANVITVGATNRDGAKAGFSNYGSTVDVSAPGGGESSFIASTWNNGLTTPTTEGYIGMQGTSMAAPHVAGVAALMQSTSPSTPATVESVLKSTARALPVACPQGCGSGIINALGAVTGVGSGALLISDVTATEGNSGTKTFTFTVSLSKALAGNVTFDIATANGTATAGSDYVSLSQTNQTITAGATSKNFSVTVNGDGTVEPNEVFYVNVSNVSGIAVAKSQGVGTIVNDDVTPLSNGVTVSPIAGASGTSFLYSLVVPAGKTSVTFTTSSGTGDADLYVSRDTIPTTSVNGWASEGNTTAENIQINSPTAGTYYVLVYAYATISGVNLVGTYVPGDNPSISIGDVSLSEGNAGTKLFTFPITLSTTSGSPVTYDIASSNGTAVAGVDYVANSAVGQSIAAGQTSANFTVSVNGDTSVEDNETFTVNLNNVSGASVADGQGQGRINNDDAASLSIGDISIAEGNSGTSTATFIVRLNTPQPNPVTYDIATSNGSASSASDYVARNVVGRYLDAGRTTQVFEVSINGDATAEANETFNVTISNVSGAVLADGAAVATITNDDGPAAPPPVAQSVSTAPLNWVDPDSSKDEKLAPECRSAKSRAEARRRGKSVAHCAELPTR